MRGRSFASLPNMATAFGAPRAREEAGAQVRQGERSTTVVLWRELPSSRQPDDNDGDDDDHRRMFARAFSVFNVAQVDGYQRPTAAILSESQRLAHAEAFIANLGIRTVFEGWEVGYCPSTDAVFMPPFSFFRDPASFYGVWLHENGHASGAKHRLDRDLSGRFGSAAYAAEERGVEISQRADPRRPRYRPPSAPRSCSLYRVMAQGPEGRPSRHLHRCEQGAAGGRRMHAQQPQCEEIAA